MIFKVLSKLYFEKSSNVVVLPNIWGEMKKSLVWHPLKNFITPSFKIRGFGYPIHHYYSLVCASHGLLLPLAWWIGPLIKNLSNVKEWWLFLLLSLALVVSRENCHKSWSNPKIGFFCSSDYPSLLWKRTSWRRWTPSQNCIKKFCFVLLFRAAIS